MSGGWGVPGARYEAGYYLTSCLRAAIAAPSVHNSQPWRFRLHPDRIDVFWDADRALRAIDPHGREGLISVGAAVLNLRVAILAAGRIPHLRLLPDANTQTLAATIMLGRPHRPDMTVKALASAIAYRRTNRRPFRDIGVREEIISQLVMAAQVEGASLTALTDPVERQAFLELIRVANEWQGEDPRYRDELAGWTATEPARGDGIPVASFGPSDRSGSGPMRDFGLDHPDAPRRNARFESAPTVVMLCTSGDTPADWLRAGQAMERVLLTATVRGVANTPMTSPTEIPELRSLLCDPSRAVPQVLLRLGYGNPCPATPRRPLADVVEMADVVDMTDVIDTVSASDTAPSTSVNR